MRLAPVGGAKSKGNGCPDQLDAGMCGYRVAGQALSVQRRAMQLKLLLWCNLVSYVLKDYLLSSLYPLPLVVR